MWNDTYFKTYLLQEDTYAEVLRPVYLRWMQDEDIKKLFDMAESGIAERQWQTAASAMSKVEKSLRERGEDAFLAIAALTAGLLPTAIERQKKEGICEEILVDSYQDYGIWVRQYQNYHKGAIGLSRYLWVLHTFAGDLLRFGSLQFEEKEFDLPYLLLKKKEDGTDSQWDAIPIEGVYFDSDGHPAYTGGKQSEGIQKATQMQIKQVMYGQKMDLQAGKILKDIQEWDMEEYEVAVRRKTLVLGIHIPAGADLSEECVQASFREAKEFFQNRNRSYPVFICESWMLDTHLREMMPETSRIRKFSELFYHLPVFELTPQIFERVFGFDFQMDKLVDWECHTSLQKRLKEHVLAGETVCSMGGFIPWKLV